ncbi:hypothetical protein B0H14DRAFT_3645885 [Mycena olivaceomarginata]|nr:hypothetical protein B0H14DRAFT_3645885 [Mycena olivaceomarginata]
MLRSLAEFRQWAWTQTFIKDSHLRAQHILWELQWVGLIKPELGVKPIALVSKHKFIPKDIVSESMNCLALCCNTEQNDMAHAETLTHLLSAQRIEVPEKFLTQHKSSCFSLKHDVIRTVYGVGFSIYGFKDKFLDSLLFFKIYPDVRSQGAGGHIFLDFVQEMGCKLASSWSCDIHLTSLPDIPIQLTTDKGSAVGWLYAFMSTLREIYAADIDIALYPFHVLIKSIHNTVIEEFWQQLQEKLGLNLKDFLLHGKVEHLFNAHDPWHE